MELEQDDDYRRSPAKSKLCRFLESDRIKNLDPATGRTLAHVREIHRSGNERRDRVDVRRA